MRLAADPSVPRWIVALGLVAIVAKQTFHRHGEVGMRKHGAVIAAEHDIAGIGAAPFRPLITMAIDTQLIENGLDIARKIVDIRHSIDRCDLAGRTAERCQVCRWIKRLGALLMTTDAAGYFTRLNGQKALHAFDGNILIVQSDEEQTAQGGQFHVRRSIRLHRYGSQHTFQCK